MFAVSAVNRREAIVESGQFRLIYQAKVWKTILLINFIADFEIRGLPVAPSLVGGIRPIFQVPSLLRTAIVGETASPTDS